MIIYTVLCFVSHIEANLSVSRMGQDTCWCFVKYFRRRVLKCTEPNITNKPI